MSASPNSTASTASIASIYASSASATASASTSTDTDDDKTGLIAGVSVLAVLLALTTGIAIFLFLRWRRALERQDRMSSETTKLNTGRRSSELESAISTLENQLQRKNSQLRKSQAALLSYGRRVSSLTVDDRAFNQQYNSLSMEINDWVLTYFRDARINPSMDPAAAEMVHRSLPGYASFLQDTRKKFLVFRTVVADIMFEAFKTGEIGGSTAFSQLKNTIAADLSAAEANQWRSMTTALLEKCPSFRQTKTSTIRELSTRIDYLTSNIGNLPYSEARLSQLVSLVSHAAALAADLGRQEAEFSIEKPNSGIFDAATMVDVFQDSEPSSLQGAVVQAVVFPALTRIGIEAAAGHGQMQQQTTMISKAQVMI